MTGALVPLGTGDNLPDPTALRTLLQAQLTEHVKRIREERGPVTGPEDCYDLIRRLTAVGERMREYDGAFKAVGKSVNGELERELIESTGEAKPGEPRGNLTVPTAGGDIRLTRNTANHYDIDAHQVIAVTAAQVSAEWMTRAAALGSDAMVPSVEPQQYAIEVAERVVELFGAATPGVTRVRALADELARAGDDVLAKVAADAIVKTTTYHGVKAERKT